MSKLTEAIRSAAISGVTVGEPGTFERTFRFSADFPGFAGHFPGFPILPAVAQVQTAFCLAEEGLGRPLRLVGMEHAKFHLQLGPDEEITVLLREKRREGCLACEVRLSRGGELASAFVLLLEEGEAP